MASKGKGKSSSSKDSTIDLTRLLTTQDQRDKFMHFFFKKNLTPPKFGNLPTFNSDCFDFPRLFQAQKVYEFISDHGVYYPDVVRAFYCNMEFENQTLTSSVKGVPISLSLQQFGECLKIPFEGVEIPVKNNAQLPGYVKKDFYYDISRISEHEYNEKRRKLTGKVPEKPSWSAGNLTINDRMIHYFLSYVLVPKMSNHATINDLEMQLLFAVKNRIQVNWAYVIMHHLANHDEYSAGLPYARVLTKIFRKFKVNLTSESIAKMEPSDCAITTDVINSKMGVVYDSYLKTYNYITHNADDEIAPPPPPQQPHAGEPTNQMIMDCMTQGFNQFDAMRQEFGSLRQDMAGMSSRMDRFEAYQRRDEDDQMNHD